MKPTTTEDVFELMESFVTSAALGAALELGLFWLLAEQPLDAPSVAQTLRIPVIRCGYWLQLLDHVGLLEQSSQGYAPSSVAQRAILDTYSQELWAFLARELRRRSPVVRDLARHIHEPGSVWAAQGLTPPDYFAEIVENPETARVFTRALYEVHFPLADELAESLDLTGAQRMLDLGGGSGVMSLALLRRYPHLSALVIDIPNVCAVGREIARENSLEERITYQMADYMRDELPSGFDMVLQCDAGPYSATFFRKIRRALNPGGQLVIVDRLPLTEGVAPTSRVYEPFSPLYGAFRGSLTNPDHTDITAAEVQTRLEEAGFQLLSLGNLSGSWLVIQARK